MLFSKQCRHNEDNMTKLFNYILLVGTPTPIVNIKESDANGPTLLITFRLRLKTL